LNKVVALLDEWRYPFADGGARRKIHTSDNPAEILRDQEAREILGALTDAQGELLE
jgi:hypothetical protein